MPAAVGADIAIALEQLGVGEAGLQVKRIDVGYAARTDDAADGDLRLQAGLRVVPAAKQRNLRAQLPAHLAASVMGDCLL